MQSISRKQLAVLWLVIGAIAVCAAAMTKPNAYYRGEVVPNGNDAFYHARRVLDTVADPASFYEFDARIHVPEGSVLPWPWGYDYALAMVARAGLAMGISSDPMEILAWIPVLSVLISVALLLLICREIGLSTPTTALAGLCMALSPTTQLLHGVGAIDHHFAEFMFILAALLFGMRWLDEPDRATRALALGATLGIAPAIHNGLFILQLPLLTTALVFWLQGKSSPHRGALTLAAALLLTTTAILLPSLSFRLGRFEFYTLSWFHLYVATCTCVALVFMSFTRVTRLTLAGLLGLGLLMLLPLAKEIAHGEMFLTGNVAILGAISEMQPPLVAARVIGAILLNHFYSLLIWITPIAALICLAGSWFHRLDRRLLLWVTSLMGLGLLFMQLRLHYFGSFALYLPWLVAVEYWTRRIPEHRKTMLLITTLILVLAYVPVLRYQLVAPQPVSNDTSFVPLRPLFEDLRKACESDPGVVLADNNLGHLIRYYSECSVIANNFLLAPLDFAKIEEIRRYLSLNARELEEQAPSVKYVIVRPADLQTAKDGRIRFRFYFGGNSRLANDLLFDDTERVPASYTLISEVRFTEANNIPYAKLYRIDRGANGSASSLNSATN